MKFTCPVCGFDDLKYAPEDFTICPSCGTEFGIDDKEYSIQELKDKWIKGGRRWWSISVPSPIATVLIGNHVMRTMIDSQTTEGSKEINLGKFTTLDFVEVRFPDVWFKGKPLPGRIGSTSSRNPIQVIINA
jgi:hypothetical protein